MSDLDAVLITAHRGNINRYRRLLRTQLTELEREFIERRLAAEQSAVSTLLARKRSLAPQSDGRPSVGQSMIAAKALARARDGTAQSR